MKQTLELLALTAIELERLLSNASLTSRELVQACLKQIEKHNHQGLCLNAIISVAPRELLYGLAEELDAERAAGKIRSPLHGIPVILKVSFRLCFE